MLWILFALILTGTQSRMIRQTLIGGQAVNHTDYPELVYFINEDHARCSGTLIGPRVIITAAHCIAGTGQIQNSFTGPDDIPFAAHCQVAPQYIKQMIYDFALCKVDGKIPNAKPATLGTRKSAPKDGDQVILVGYGCTDPSGVGGNNGILKAGTAEIFSRGSVYYPWFSAKAPDSALCPGDSGGPALKFITNHNRHVVIAINSRGDVRTISLLSALHFPKSRRFIISWLERNHVDICGVNINCKIYPNNDDENV